MDKLKAYRYALAAHKDQKYGDGPYRNHLSKVVDICAAFSFTEAQVLEAAWLHDVVEDTEVTLEDLRREFSELVVYIVAFCTDEEGHNRKERKRKTYRRIRAQVNKDAPELTTHAIAVKLADRLANVDSSYAGHNEGLMKMYLGERDTFYLALFNGDSRLTPMWDAYDTLMEQVEKFLQR